jgi:antitoxin (DNA-binding transcriptional repressor) of toxin-antitoxin stability system
METARNSNHPTIEVSNLATRRVELKLRLQAGEEVLLADQGITVGVVTPSIELRERKKPRFDRLKDQIWIADDFDAPMKLVVDESDETSRESGPRT